MIYQIVFLILLYAGYVKYDSDRNRTKAKTGFVKFCCVVLVLQSALRNLAVGADTYQYFNRFYTTASLSWNEIWYNFVEVYWLGEGKDPGYPLIEKIFQLVLPNFRCWLLAVAIFFFYSWGKFINRYCDTINEVLIALSVYLMLFYNFFSITGIRQTIAVALSMLCFMALQDKKYVRLVLLGVIAFTIHKSAIIILLFPLLNRFKNVKLAFAISTLVMLFFAFNRQSVVDYTLVSLEEETGYQIRLPYTLMAFYIIITFMMLHNVLKYKWSGNIKHRLFFFYLPTYCWIPLMGWDSPFMRESLFFSIYTMILIPSYISEQKKKIPTIEIVFVVFACVYFLMNNYNYGFMWNEMQLGENYGNMTLPISTQFQ